MSASMAFAFTAGSPIAAVSVKAGAAEVFKNMPLLVFALAGGFTTKLYFHDDHHGEEKGVRRLCRPTPQRFISQLLSRCNQWNLMVRTMV